MLKISLQRLKRVLTGQHEKRRAPAGFRRGQNAKKNWQKSFLNYCGLLTTNLEFFAKISNFEALFGAKKAPAVKNFHI